MKLSCIRCKQKKLRCDRNDPCDRCIQANAVCATAERKTRISHKSRDTQVIAALNQRIDLLERALQSTDMPASGSQVNSPSIGADTPATTTRESTSTTSRRKPSVEAVKTSAEWLERDLRDVKTFSIERLQSGGDLVHDSPVNQAISALDGALSGLGDEQEVIISEDIAAIMTKDEARAAVRSSLELMRGEFFTSLLELDFMISLADIITSPHVQIDPAARLVYHNLVFHGAVVGECQTRVTARALYLQCLQAVPTWQQHATGSMMDLVAASIMTWTCIISFDYNLAWKFHSQSCRIAKQMGLHHLDVLSVKGTKAADVQRNQRLGFWQLVLADLFFRLHYDKESCISADASPRFVNVPEVLDVVGSRPRAEEMIPHIIWGRVIFLFKGFFDHYDQIKNDPNGLDSKTFQDKVDSICGEVEDMVNDWNLPITLMEIQTDNPLKAWAYADTVIGSYNMLLHIDKLRTSDSASKVSQRSLRVSRILLDATVKFDEMTQKSKVHGALYMYCIAFYPFRAFFSLYYHILTSDNPEDYKEDILRLERICAVMKKAAAIRSEYIPIAKAVVSINNVAKQIQIARTSQSPAKQWNALGNWPLHTPESIDHQLIGAADIGFSQSQQQQQQQPSSDTAANMAMDFQQTNLQWLPNFGDFQFNTAEDVQQAAAQPHFQPIEYMQAVENQFQGGNWYSSMWDITGGPLS